MADKTDLTFKRLINREYTTTAKSWYEQDPGISFILPSSDIWISSIPSTPPAVDSPVVVGYRSSNRFILTKDITVNNNKAWLAKINGNRVGQFISPRYGQGYTVKLFDGSNNQVFTTHPCGWFFDYENGILTFDQDPSSVGLNATSFSIEVYRYVGSTLTDFLASGFSNSWAGPVIDFISTPPSNPIKGDRYLIKETGTGAWSGHDNEAAEWDGQSWVFYPINKSGSVIYVINLDRIYVYDSQGTATWSWSGIDAIDLDYDNSNSGLTATNVNTAIDELADRIRWDSALGLIVSPTPNP